MTKTSSLEKENEQLRKDLDAAIKAIDRLQRHVAEIQRKTTTTYHLARDNQIKINYMNHVLKRN